MTKDDLNKFGYTVLMLTVFSENKDLVIECARELRIPIQFGITIDTHPTTPVYTKDRIPPEKIDALKTNFRNAYRKRVNVVLSEQPVIRHTWASKYINMPRQSTITIKANEIIKLFEE